MQKKLVLSTAALDNDSKLRLIKSLGDDWEYRIESNFGDDGLGSVEVLLLGSKRWLSKEKVDKMKNLHLIQSFPAGLDHLDFSLIPPNVIVCANAGAFAEPIAEFVFGAVVNLGRNLYQHDKEIREGKFVQSPPGLFLRGKTIGIIGTGGIGQSVARVAKCLGMITLGVNTTGSPILNFDRVSTINELNSLLHESDVLVVAVPLTSKTRDLLGKEEFNALKPDCIIVNVARGAIINQKAFYEFLRDHQKAKAAIDVWWKYPKENEKFAQDYPINKLPNILLSPHYSDGVDEFAKLGSDNAVDNIIRYLNNEPLKGVARHEDYV